MCGAAAIKQQSLKVDNVHDFPGHIACDSLTESELVVPIIVNGVSVGVLDLDCLVPSGFTEKDVENMEQVVHLIEKYIESI